MPRMDGYETCRQLKLNPELQHIPVIFLTAKSQEAEIRKGLQLGAVGYLVKPFNPMNELTVLAIQRAAYARRRSR